VALECRTTRIRGNLAPTPPETAPENQDSAALGEQGSARPGKTLWFDKTWFFAVRASVGDMTVTHLSSPPPIHPVILSREKHPADALGACVSEAHDSHEAHTQPHALAVFSFEEWVDPWGGDAGQGTSSPRNRTVFLEIDRIRLYYSVPFLQAVMPCVQGLVLLLEAHRMQHMHSEGWQAHLCLTLSSFLACPVKEDAGPAGQGARAGEAATLAAGDTSHIILHDTPARRALRALASHCRGGTTLKMDLRVELPDLIVPAASLTRDKNSSLLVLRGGSLVGRSVAATASPSKPGEPSAPAALPGPVGFRHKVAVDGTSLLCCTRADDWSLGLRRDL
jgi:hypothetical protein